MQWGAPADPADAHDGTGAGDLIHVHDRVAREHAEVHGLVGPIGELLQDGVGGPHQIEAGHRRTREPDQPET